MTSNLELTADVVASYAANHELAPDELATVITSVHQALSHLGQEPSAPFQLTPAQIRKSVRQEALVSFEDGRPYKQLRRHLGRLGLTPEAYRRKWGLPGDYPMVASDYSRRRSALAIAAGLGKKVRKASGAAAEDAAERAMEAAGQAVAKAAPVVKGAASRTAAAAVALAGELADKAADAAAEVAKDAANKVGARAKQIVIDGADAVADALSTDNAQPAAMRRGRPPKAKA